MKNTPFVPLHKPFNSGAEHQYRKQRKMGTVDKVVVLCVFTVGNTLTLLNVQYKQNRISGGAQTRQVNIHMDAVKMFKIRITAMKYVSSYNSIFNSIYAAN